MTKLQFITEMRANRGRLTRKSTVSNMEFIFDNASSKFTYYMLNRKKIGIDNAAEMVDKLTRAEQTELVLWIEEKGQAMPVERIEVKIELIIQDR